MFAGDEIFARAAGLDHFFESMRERLQRHIRGQLGVRLEGAVVVSVFVPLRTGLLEQAHVLGELGEKLR